LPKSWNVPSQLSRVKADILEAKKKAQKAGLAPPMYIVKPSDTAQGKGIFFATDVETIVKALNMTDGKIKN
jgi:biotin carboxylase